MSLNTDVKTGDVLPDWAAEDDGNLRQSQPSKSARQSGGGGTVPATTTIEDGVEPTTSIRNTTTTTGQHGGKFDWRAMIKRDGRLLLITALIIIVMNIPYVKYILYPFSLFSTWVHEFCHGWAAILVGGRFLNMKIFPDTSGLAYSSLPGGDGRRGFVAQAGYTGTAVVGCLLLIFRRTKRGPRTGTMTLAVTMLLSTAIWMRNVFGFIMIALIGIALGICAWKLPSARIRDVYTCIAVTCALNAITNVGDLFGSNQVVNGEPSETDAHTMADVVGGPFWIWAILWLLIAIVMTGVGLVFAIPGPDECADFKCCGVCVDFGIFNICNKKRSSGSNTT